jgi:tetratricopeptide (TPR) repeat protein
LEIDPKFAYAIYYKAEALDKLDRKREAAKSYRKFIEIAPANNEERIRASNQRLRDLEG